MKRRTLLAVLALLVIGMFGMFAVPSRHSAEPPVYSCDSLAVEKKNVDDGRTFVFTPRFTVKNGAVITGIFYDFGDGIQDDTRPARAQVEHTYQTEGAYNASVILRVQVGHDEKLVTGNGCYFAFVVAQPHPILSDHKG